MAATATATGISAGTGVLMTVALLLMVVGLASLSEATAGVGMVSAGAVCGIIGRIMQASVHHREAMRR